MSLSPDPEPTQAAVSDGGGAGDRGRLKIYLGYAPHTGKTWRLLEEARRRKARGQDVVIGWLRRKDQPAVSGLLEGLEHIAPREVDGRATLDVDAVLARRPEVCFVDELAAANPPGSRNRHRWQDVQDMLAAGISVVTALNIQYVAALRPTILKLLGRAPEETVPDELLREAEEVLLVDASLESVKDRSGSGLSERDLLNLREVALLYSADTVEENVLEYRQEHQIETVWETQERIMVCVTAYSRGPLLIDRAHRVAERWNGELWAVYVTPDEKWSNLSPADAERVRGFLDLAKSKGAHVEIVEDTDPARGIMDFARRHDITQIFLGHAAAYPFRGALSRTVAGRIILEATGMDVNVVADDVKSSPDVTAPGPAQPQLPFLARLLSGAPRPESRGHLRIYLGYAPGVGKTYQMLLDGQYLRDQGQDVVVGYVESEGREDVTELLGTLEVIPRLDGSIDMEALKARRPQICLIDDLAAFTTDGKRRWEKVEELRDAGIHVFTTLDVSDVESLKDTVECIAGLQVKETVPDWIVEEADEVVFVDVPVRALLNRVKRGVVFIGNSVVPQDLNSFFTEGCLSALRELAMRLTADRVQDDLEELDKTATPAEDTEAVLVCVHPRPSGGAAVRRARRAADRLGAPCYAAFVAPDEDWTGISPEDKAVVEGHLELARSLHIETHVLYGSNIARTLVDFAIRHSVTRIFLGRSHKTGWREFFQRSVIEQVIRLSPKTDIHVVADR